MFGGAEPQQQCFLVLIGGQPGAGKTRGTHFAQALHEERVVVVSGDDYRYLHPEYKRLQREDPEQMPVVTQPVSSGMVERALDYARKNRVSVLVEGTFRNPTVATGTAEAFHRDGFDVHVVALAVPPQVSRAATLSRYYETLGTEQNRWTPPASHDAAVAGMTGTVEALARSSTVARVTVLSREGEVLADSEEPGEERARQMRSVIEHAHTRPLTADEQELVDAIEGAALPAPRAATPPRAPVASRGEDVARARGDDPPRRSVGPIAGGPTR